jgi:broad specificity phosphatase PhoE
MFLLIRHASHDLLGKALAGRAQGVPLNAQGRREAEALAERLAPAGITAIYTSPVQRARETAAPLARKLELPPRLDAALDEIDFGAWTGRTFDEIGSDPAWSVWVHRRSAGEPPAGESMRHVQQRVVGGIERLRREQARGTIALVTHGDVIKAALAHFLGISLDNLESFEIAAASVSVLEAGENWTQVKLVNGTAVSREP